MGYYQRSQREWIWHHNSLYGRTKMMEKQLRAIETSETSSDFARLLARDLQVLVGHLSQELYTFRREPDGSIKQIKHDSSFRKEPL